LSAGFPANNQGALIGGKGGPQIQSPMGAYLASRAGLGMGGGFGGYYGPQSPYKKRGYQLARPGAPGQEQITGGGGYSGQPTPLMAGGLGGSLGAIMGGMGMQGRGFGAGAFQNFGDPRNKNMLGLEGIAPGSPNNPESLVQGQRSIAGIGGPDMTPMQRLQQMGRFAQGFRGMPGYTPSGSAGFGDTGYGGSSLMKRLLNARLGGL